MATFDVLTESWIPVVNLNGDAEDLSLRDVLYRAHELVAVRDPLPTVEFGVSRLLTALVLDIFEPRTLTGLEDLLRMEHFDRVRVDEYFAKYSDRFDLFHGKYPFLQSSGMDSETLKPLAGLLPPIPSGTNSFHFHHYHQDDFGVSPAAATRLLTTIAPFMTAGGAGLPPSINGAPVWYVWVSRPESTLFESICLNICVVPLMQAVGTEGPSWRSTRPVTTERLTKASLLESLTWRPRRIQLVASGSGICSLSGLKSDNLVRTMKFGPGVSSGFDPPWTDPSVPYRISDKGPIALRPREGRDIWRDTGAIAFLRHDNNDFARPRLMDQFADLVAQRAFRPSANVSVKLYGMRTDMKMKVFEWQQESLNLPADLLRKQSAYQRAQSAMEKAEKTSFALKQAIKRVYPREGKGNSGAFETIIGCAEQQFWSRLRRPYELFLSDISPLSPEDDGDQIRAFLEVWEKQVRSTGWWVLDDAIDDLDSDSGALKRSVEARKFFGGAINRAFDDALPTKRKTSRDQKIEPAPTVKGE